MPGRKIPLVNGEIYHVINRGIASRPLFLIKRDYRRKLSTIFYYQNVNLPFRYSFFIRLPRDRRQVILDGFKDKRNFQVEIIAYCLIPNHIHLLLKQVRDKGISTFMSNVTNSYTRYLNSKRHEIGPIYQGKFKAVRIESDEQLLHVQRYIHLNPFSSYVLKSTEELEGYPYSSLPEYLNKTVYGYCKKDIVMHFFKDKVTFRDFILNQADYQRNLDEIKHLTLE
ncbi:hypothetical protein A2962_03235 [Candidatus Woesebacteria bacterium RIFCSPLOWO2_01_FULL_39_61]|uniref:Transposase IS200-like domain-containing protein n=1 Tax=Candidatus Woesebacteria bacterium RIFCSPHIGHO2_02_FULL_39_13 TaxID=1802505 RepID=A0A1F7Z2R5_9BACT|nr:MAG: hypothetical protein A2692_04320 [Candidatus Woesebacteria bacterium RIFCSPHIGHO2_01_FULL_39_95]OGM33837.1 MAG: hypothetical protein A3D01_02605 [Candidatus Woesebacteria bacterium RIFCSPHIGHO2_02_FULL_39_13]OGM38998.1 MAG: hypothetical protein A3E13_04875 [Candidatus Woesebacteria bacterium RIFCSPHIGHO2_12_FULL_40_20]OGM67503.1 MAG: hypothetical protein A2962_03235 [Candidatus Woesebacteria bacterium RIFCSPLOWO2_01_FULL_39_61]OGM72834.1 MAG: hypothetical protein A3H19_05740 [Candidatus